MSKKLMDIIGKIRELLGPRRRLDEISRRLEQNAEAISTADKRNQQEHKFQNERLDRILSEHEQSERKRTTNDERHYTVQNSMRKATWCAFIAAAAYAAISGWQWYDLRRSIEISNRAWVGLDRPVDVTDFTYDPKEGVRLAT